MNVSLRSLTLISASLALALTMQGCSKEVQQGEIPATPVDVSIVSTQDMPVISHLTGRANSTRKAEVRPQVSGIIQERLFEEGTIVKKGTQLYQIDPSVYEAQVASAEAALASAKATLHSSQLRAERFASLLNQKAVSKQDYDDAQATYLSNKAAVQSAEAALKTANINLAYTKVYAPITGTISRSNITEGALVSNAQATPLATIQQLDPIYVDLGQTVEDNIAMRKAIANGQLKTENGKATVDIYYSNGDKYPYQGTLEFAEVSVDETTGMVNLRALIPNPDNSILPSMFLRGDINEGVTPNAVVVTAAGVQREANGTTYVLLANDQNLVERRNVVLGTSYNNMYLVKDGLKGGEKVIISNTQKIREGAPVTPLTQEQAQAMDKAQAEKAQAAQ